MKTRWNLFKAVAVAVVWGLVAARSNAGPKWEIDEDSWLQLTLCGQVHYSHMEDAAAENDFYLRRGRLILAGQIMDGVKVFAETDNPNAGRYGAGSAKTEIQDAFVDLQLGETDHWLEAGLILLPFSFETKASCTSLLGIDYNLEAIKLVNTFCWRDYGAELHGHFWNKLAYRVGVFDGYDTAGSSKNPDAALRYTGHVALNLLGESQTGWFFTQNALGKSQYLAVGLGYDRQDDATFKTLTTPLDGAPADDASETTIVEDNEAWVVDVQSSFNLRDNMALLVNGAYYDWDNAAFEGNTAFVETGLLLQQKWLPTFKYARGEADGKDSLTDYTVGIDYFLKGHNARAGLEYRWGDSDEWVLLGLQFVL